jgi:hypothetical protein
VDVAGAVLEHWLATEHAAAGQPRDLADVEAAQAWARRQALARLG